LDRKAIQTDWDNQPKKDYSMKEGSTIKVNLKVKTKGKERQVGEGNSTSSSGGFGSLHLEDNEEKDEGFGTFQDSNW
jgi:hypothetical protein